MRSNLTIKEYIPLSDLTTFKIGGEARFFVKANAEIEIIEALQFADENGLDTFILGGGSNVLISDEGFDGLVLQINLTGISLTENDNRSVFVTAGAGEDWDELVAFCVRKNLAGFECLSGIPGLVGGTPIQNVGAYGQEVSETIVSVKVFDTRSNEIRTLANSDCGFEYRKSIFNTTEKGRFIVLEVTYSLTKNGEPKIVYSDLKTKFGARKPSLKQTREAVCEIRASKGMLVRQGGLDAQSAGSFFKNPIISIAKFAELENTFVGNDIEKVPNYPVDAGSVKIPAAWLIEQAGFKKGFTKGNAGLSTRHSLALTNRGNATAREIIELKNEIQMEILSRYGLELFPEPNFIGFDDL